MYYLLYIKSISSTEILCLINVTEKLKKCTFQAEASRSRYLVESIQVCAIVLFCFHHYVLTAAAAAHGGCICFGRSGTEPAVPGERRSCIIHWKTAAVHVKLQICGIRVEPENRLNGGIEQRLDTQHSLSMHKLFITLILFTLMWLTPKDCSRVVCRSSFSTVRLQSEHTHRGSCRALGVLAGCAVPFWPEMPASEGTTVSLRSHRHKRQRSPAV